MLAGWLVPFFACAAFLFYHALALPLLPRFLPPPLVITLSLCRNFFLTNLPLDSRGVAAANSSSAHAQKISTLQSVVRPGRAHRVFKLTVPAKHVKTEYGTSEAVS